MHVETPVLALCEKVETMILALFRFFWSSIAHRISTVLETSFVDFCCHVCGIQLAACQIYKIICQVIMFINK